MVVESPSVDVDVVTMKDSRSPETGAAGARKKADATPDKPLRPKRKQSRQQQSDGGKKGIRATFHTDCDNSTTTTNDLPSHRKRTPSCQQQSEENHQGSKDNRNNSNNSSSSTKDLLDGVSKVLLHGVSMNSVLDTLQRSVLLPAHQNLIIVTYRTSVRWYELTVTDIASIARSPTRHV